jgi:hypothetical protein
MYARLDVEQDGAMHGCTKSKNNATFMMMRLNIDPELKHRKTDTCVVPCAKLGTANSGQGAAGCGGVLPKECEAESSGHNSGQGAAGCVVVSSQKSLRRNRKSAQRALSESKVIF